MLDLGLQWSQIISVCSINATFDINFCPNLAQICKSATSLSPQHIRKKPTSTARDECQCIPPWRHPPPEWRFPSWHTSASNWQKWWCIPQTNPYWRWFSSFVSGKVLVPCGSPLIVKHLPLQLHTLYFQQKKLFVDQEFQVHLVVAQHTRWCEPLKMFSCNIHCCDHTFNIWFNPAFKQSQKWAGWCSAWYGAPHLAVHRCRSWLRSSALQCWVSGRSQQICGWAWLPPCHESSKSWKSTGSLNMESMNHTSITLFISILIW